MPESTATPASDPTPTSSQPPDHRQCRHLKMDGVRCRRQVPLGHVHCYNHRHNRNPSFVKRQGKIRVPLLEDISSLQVTTTAALHALLNKSLDPREVRTILRGVSVAAGVLRLDLSERRFLAATGQSRPEPVIDFAVIGHEHVALEDPLPAAAPASVTVTDPVFAASAPSPAPRRPCSSLDPEDDFLTPATFLSFDAKMRIPPPPPGTRDPLGLDGANWPCPYRFDFCQGPGPKASCHYCTGQMRWEDVHPGEPDPGAPGPLPTVHLDYVHGALRNIPAPQMPAETCPEPAAFSQPVESGDTVGENLSAPSLSPSIGDRVGSDGSEPAATHSLDIPTSRSEKETTVIRSEPSASAAPAPERNHQLSRESCHPLQKPSDASRAESPNGSASLPAQDSALPAPIEPTPTDCEPEWIYATAPKSQHEPASDLVLVAAAEPAIHTPIRNQRCYPCASAESATSISDAPHFSTHFFHHWIHRYLRGRMAEVGGNVAGHKHIEPAIAVRGRRR